MVRLYYPLFYFCLFVCLPFLVIHNYSAKTFFPLKQHLYKLTQVPITDEYKLAELMLSGSRLILCCDLFGFAQTAEAKTLPDEMSCLQAQLVTKLRSQHFSLEWVCSHQPTDVYQRKCNIHPDWIGMSFSFSIR